MSSYRLVQYFIFAAVAAFLIVFLVMPVLTVVGGGCQWRLLAEVFRSDIYRSGLLNSLGVALVTTGIAGVVSLFLALLYDRFDFPGKWLCPALMMLPMILPPFVGALGFQQLLGHYGVVNALLTRAGLARIDFLGGEGKFWAVCLIEALHLYPVFYLNLVTALGNIDPALSEAAANIGAGRWKRLFRIQLPLLRSGFLAGGAIVLVWSFTELGTPLMLGYNRLTPVQVYNGLTELNSNRLPFALVVVMLAFSLILYCAAKICLGDSGNSAVVKGAAHSCASQLSGFKRFLPTVSFLLMALLSVLPHLALVGKAFSVRWYDTVLPEIFTIDHVHNALANVLVIPSIVNSLLYSMLAMLFALIGGAAVSLISVRWRLRGGVLLDLLAMLPLAVPGMVVAFGFLSMASCYSWAKTCFNPLENPLLLLSVAYAVRRIPYVVRSVSSGLEQTPEELELAARNFGAGPLAAFRKITLPLISANLLAGALFAFSFSMLEVSDSLILAQKSVYYPITKALLELSRIFGYGPAAASAFGVWTMLFLALTLVSAGIILGKKIGNIFHL